MVEVLQLCPTQAHHWRSHNSVRGALLRVRRNRTRIASAPFPLERSRSRSRRHLLSALA